MRISWCAFTLKSRLKADDDRFSWTISYSCRSVLCQPASSVLVLISLLSLMREASIHAKKSGDRQLTSRNVRRCVEVGGGASRYFTAKTYMTRGA